MGNPAWWNACSAAAPLPTGAAEPRPRPFARAFFAFDHADCGLFHVLEDSIRLQNAAALGLLPPADADRCFAADAGCVNDDNATTVESVPAAVAPAYEEQTSMGRVAFKAGSEIAETLVPDDSGDVPLPEALEAHLERGELLDVVLVQALATRRLTDDEATAEECDMLTGFHLTDGVTRFVAVEGVATGAMHTLVAAVRPCLFWWLQSGASVVLAASTAPASRALLAIGVVTVERGTTCSCPGRGAPVHVVK